MCSMAQVQSAFDTCGTQLHNFASNFAEGASTAWVWIKENATKAKDQFTIQIQKLADWAKPVFGNFSEWAKTQYEALKDYVNNNPQQFAIVATISGILGAIGAAVATFFCCQRNEQPPAPPVPPVPPAPNGAAGANGAGAPAARTAAPAAPVASVAAPRTEGGSPVNAPRPASAPADTAPQRV